MERWNGWYFGVSDEAALTAGTEEVSGLHKRLHRGEKKVCSVGGISSFQMWRRAERLKDGEVLDFEWQSEDSLKMLVSPSTPIL